VVTVVFLVLPLFVFGAVRFLRYADEPMPADVIVLFLGPESAQRQARALDLLHDAYADSLFIPAEHKVLSRAEAAAAKPLMTTATDRGNWLEQNGESRYPGHYEQTHMEILVTRDFMAEKGFRSAIFVSSPYHLRRIRLISGNVFGPEVAAIRFVPYLDLIATGHTPSVGKSIVWISSEYLKIGWYLAYSLAELFAPPEPGHDP
jgi:hypothetical protein